jgi:hypothetical protein
MTDSRPFISGQVVIDSLRDNGYKNAAYALAELIDNSIQAEADTVRVICYEQVANNTDKALKRVCKIGVLDNGKGMSSEHLYKALEFGASENRNNAEGMGKFGMGLPNSSISQCKRVEVWSWKNSDEIYYTYLDIDQMKSGELEVIPSPIIKEIPRKFLNTLGDKLSASGTFILWSDLDRLQWKTSKSIYKHSQEIVGRMYRYYLYNGEATIWFDRFLDIDNCYKPEAVPEKFKANDPLYLLRNTSLDPLPSPYADEPFFNLIKEETVEIEFDGAIHQVKVRGSVVNPSIFKSIRNESKGYPGGSIWGKHTLTNFGVSVVRSNRELELKDGGFFDTKLRDKGRFIGVEVSFPPALDVVFGVINNKQSAVNLFNIQKEDEAEREGLSVGQYEADLLSNNDPLIHLFRVINTISLVIDSLWNNLSEIDFTDQSSQGGSDDGSRIFDGILDDANINRGKINPIPTDDTEISIDDIISVISESHGNDDRDTIPSPEEILRSGLRYKIEELSFDSSAFFDATRQNGFTLIQINKNHSFYSKIIQEVSEEQQGMLELTLAAWSRMEEESSSVARDQYKNARRRWGEVLTDFLAEDIC